MYAFSAPQRRVLKFATARSPEALCAAVGAVRSGKTWAIGLSFAMFLARQTESLNHALLAVSVEVAMRNIGFDLLDHIVSIGGRAEVNKVYGTRILVEFPGRPQQSVWVIGASDDRARRRLQGSTLMSLVAEEVALLPEKAWQLGLSRLSLTGAKCWASANPEGPGNYFKRDVLDRIEDYRGMELRFLMRDNPSLDEETIARFESTYKGFQHQRLILGEWAAAAGAIYPTVPRVTGEPPKSYGWLTLGLDYATSGTTSVLAMRSPKPMDRGWVTHELYHTGRDAGLLDVRTMAARVAQWCLHTLKSRPDGVTLVHDPSMPEEAERAYRYHGFHLRAGQNDVLPGIQSCHAAFEEGRLSVHERCEQLRQELAGYVWDEKAALIGEDRPVKAADHGADACRYLWYTLSVKPHVGGVTGVQRMPPVPMRAFAGGRVL